MAKSKSATSTTGAELVKVQALVKELIEEGEKPPPTIPGTWHLDTEQLAAWYSKCSQVSSLLGKDNPWEKQLTSWDLCKVTDLDLRRAMLGVLKTIQNALQAKS